MAFRETGVLAERIAMRRDFDKGFFTASELADRYGVSRETFYVWKRRRESGDERWFEALSRAPDSCPNATPETQISAILTLRARLPHFGPKKIRAKLDMKRPQIIWHAASTIAYILKREGLISAKSSNRRPVPQGETASGSDTPNGEWAIDFKGWFRTLCGTRRDPLTLTDTASRYLIETRAIVPRGRVSDVQWSGFFRM
jgi:transposase-like protein